MIPKDIHIFLYNKKEIIPEYSEGMFRAKVDGLNYCSSSLSGLIEAISFFHSVYVTKDRPVLPPKPLSEQLGEALASSITLDEKQNAYAQLVSLHIKGDSVATSIVNSIKSKHPSYGASYITKITGKSDFAEVNTQEIFDLVANIIHRDELLKELSERLSLKSFVSKE